MIPPADKPIEVHLFTDGGCSGNPGPGGWAFILRHLPSDKEIEKSGGCARDNQQSDGAGGRRAGPANRSSVRVTSSYSPTAFMWVKA